MKIEIKNRFSGSVLFSVETKTLKLAVEAAVKSGADLSGAYLSRADLSGAYLSGAYLSRAYLSRAYLSGVDLSGVDLSGADGKKKVKIARYLGIGPIGSRMALLQVFFTEKNGIFCHTGCFKGTLEVFEAKAQKEHGDNKHGIAYAAAVALIRAIEAGKE